MNDPQRGAASVEYAIVTAIVVAALFLPMTPGGDSALEFVLKALRGFQDHTTYLLSLP